jgi:branched-chain amino acid transport system ATP-binding protein
MSEKMILEVSGLNKHFRGIYATNSVSFAIPRGGKEAIIGPNGAGKSTLFNLLTGYHKPDSGSVLFDGHDITNWSPHKIVKAGISRAFQISNIFGKMTVLQNVRTAVHAQLACAMNFWGSAMNFGAAQTDELLELCGLTSISDTIAGELAQGDKKKLELAIALASKPKLLLLDEPTAGMSLEETQDTMALVDRLNKELNLTILFTEHDMAVVFDHARKVTLLHRGEIITQGTPKAVRKNKTAQKIYLGEQH